MNVVELAQARALAAIGHRVDLITRRAAPDEPDAVELAPNVVLRHLTAGPETPLAKSAIDSYLDEFAAGLAGLGHYDLIHSHHWMSGVAALPLAKQWGIPHVQSFHSVAALPGSSLDDGEPPESPARVPGEAFVAQHSDAVVAISAAEARTVIERCGADPQIVHIVSPGVDHELFHPLDPGADSFRSNRTPSEIPGSASLPRDDDERAGSRERGYVLFAARLQPLKGPDLAISALAELPAEIRPHLIVAGDTSADFAGYADQLHRLVDDLGLTADVTFLGPQTRPDLAKLMREALLVLVPSHSETFGLVALEAEASGTPVIAAAAGGLREAVAHGETGQLMDSRRPVDWGKAMKRLLTEPGLLATMGVVARVHARRFDWGFAAIRLESLYTELIRRGNG
jgi:D-inositol-3-phosphate glycosyltransferase